MLPLVVNLYFVLNYSHRSTRYEQF